MINILKLRKLEKEIKSLDVFVKKEVQDIKEDEKIINEIAKEIETSEVASEITEKETSEATKAVSNESDTPAEEVAGNDADIFKTLQEVEIVDEMVEIQQYVSPIEEADAAANGTWMPVEETSAAQDDTSIPEAVESEPAEAQSGYGSTGEEAFPEAPFKTEEAAIDPAEAFRQALIEQVLKDETMLSRKQILAEEEEIPVSPKEEPAGAEPVKPLPEAAPKKAVAAAQKAEVKAETNAQEKHGQPDAKNKKGLESIIQLVGFNLGREYYGVDINRIREIIRTTEITKVPRAPEFIEGVINLRGSVIPVINLRTRVKMPRREYDKNTRIMIVELKDKTIGFIVDAVREVLRIPESILAPPPVLAVGRGADYITAVAKLEDELVILMDTDKVLSKEDTIKLEDNTRKK